MIPPKKTMLQLFKKLICLSCICTAITFSLPALGFQKQDNSRLQSSFVHLKNRFSSPGKNFGSAPLWVWNTKVTTAIIDSMLQEFKQQAFGGVFVHARPGLITEYLSKDWYNLFQYTVQKGKELGLNVWIYDENSYPTGFAGGLVPALMPESYNQGQMLSMSETELLPTDLNDISVVLKEENGVLKDITAQLDKEQGKTGRYYLFKKEYYGNQARMVGPPDFPYVDLLAKGVTEKFIDITFKGYEKAAGNEFGNIVPGIFSDEPSIPAHGSGTIRWTPDIFDIFKQTWGYDLRPHLPSLFKEVGEWKKIRHNYMQCISQLFIDRWSKPMFEYTEKHNLKWTGHYWEHGWPNPNDVPDNMAMYAWHQYPGIDMLFNQFDETSPNAQFGNIRAVKELASVANQLGKERTLSETYGGAGWEITFKDMKRLGDWEYVLGVNFLNQHLSWMTITGARKYDYPQSFSYHNPWFPYYKSLNQYFARLSFALSQGEQQHKILIIEPTTSAWMYWINGKQNERFTAIGKEFQSFVTTLEKAQAEYDLGSENIIKDHGKAVNGQFIVGQRAYTTVVIPPGMENIDSPTFKLLKEYAEQGGKIIQFEKLQKLDGSESMELQNFQARGKNLIQISKLDPPVIRQYFRSTDFEITPVEKSSIGGNLYHHRRLFSDGQLVFLSNASMEAASAGRIEIAGKDALLMDLFTGEIFDYPEQKQQGKIAVDFNIPAAGSMLLFVSDKAQQGFAKAPVPGNKTVIKTKPAAILRPKENTLMIDFCDVQYGDTALIDVHTITASNAVFKHHGFKKNPWDHQVQFKDEFVSRDTFSKGTGFTASYHFTITNGTDYKKFRAVTEQGALWDNITINGISVQPVKNEWWLDRSFGVLEIGKYLKPGKNTLAVSVDPMSVFAEIEPVYILGDFSLETAPKGFQIASPQPLKFGSWKEQGMPLYGHSISYVKDVKLDNINSQFEIQLGEWKGTVAAVKVNGISAGIISAEPNSLNITKSLKKGNNHIEVEVVGSLKNLLGPHHNSPKPGLVSPWQWKNIKTYPSGEKYDTYDYGLMEDFKLIRYQIKE